MECSSNSILTGRAKLIFEAFVLSNVNGPREIEIEVNSNKNQTMQSVALDFTYEKK